MSSLLKSLKKHLKLKSISLIGMCMNMIILIITQDLSHKIFNTLVYLNQQFNSFILLKLTVKTLEELE